MMMMYMYVPTRTFFFSGVFGIPEFGFRNHVAIDAKISSFASFDPIGLFASVQSGPTYDQQPPFQFSTGPFATLPHVGM